MSAYFFDAAAPKRVRLRLVRDEILSLTWSSPGTSSGRQLAATLVKELGYRVVHERGSHIVLETDEPSHQRIAIPDHKNLRLGTLNSIFRAVAQHKKIDKESIASFF